MKNSKVLGGIVISDKMDKTITVLIKNKVSHSLYVKPSIKRKKFKVHDKYNKAKIGDKVKIAESRPYSKEKHFELVEIVK